MFSTTLPQQSASVAADNEQPLVCHFGDERYDVDTIHRSDINEEVEGFAKATKKLSKASLGAWHLALGDLRLDAGTFDFTRL